MTKKEAIYQAFCEIVPYSNKEITIQVEESKDEYGNYVRVYYDGKCSSKIRFFNNPDVEIN